MALKDLVRGKTYLVTDTFGRDEIRVNQIEIGEERLCLTGFHDEFYLDDKKKRQMRSTNFLLSIPLKHLVRIIEVAKGAASLSELKRGENQ